MRVLLAYDGSPAARAAVARSGELFAGADATVVTVAIGLHDVERAASGARAVLPDDVIRTGAARLRDSALGHARAEAAEGAELALEAGFATAEEHAFAGAGPVWARLLDAASSAAADVIVCGSHGHDVLMRVIVGSVSYGLIHHAELPLLVVPAAAEGRGEG